MEHSTPAQLIPAQRGWLVAKQQANMRSMASTRFAASTRPVASLGFASAADRRAMRKAMVHMAYSTPAQFSSFYGGKMLLPECYVRRGGSQRAGWRLQCMLARPYLAKLHPTHCMQLPSRWARC